MTTLNISDILDHLVIVTEEARITTAPNPRWLNALNFAYGWLIEQDSVEYDEEHHELLVPSANTAGLVYRANGVCQCKAYTAYERPRACWHRGAARLIKNALARQERCEAQDRAERREEFSSEYIAYCSEALGHSDPLVPFTHEISYAAAQSSGIDELF